MNRKLLLRLAPLSLALALAACASSDGSSDPDDITPGEIAEGEALAPGTEGDGDHAANGAHGTDPVAEADVQDGVDVAALEPAAPEEDSASFIDAEDALLPPPPPIVPGEVDVDSLVQTAKCQRANGYRRGKKISICVTKIDGKLVEVNTARAYLRMRSAARKKGVTLYVVSGFRSMAQQRYLYNCYKTKRCNGGNLAAPPGYSNHQSGKALDLNTSARGVYSFLANRGKSYGFRRTVPSEKWHWEH